MTKKKKRAESRCRYYIREEAQRKGWDLRHISKGGDVLEEQEIENEFNDIGLNGSRPDFMFCFSGNPILIVETKNSEKEIDFAINEAIEYANLINKKGKYRILFAVGAAGEDDKGFQIIIKYLCKDSWIPLTSFNFELTTFPTKKEIELALQADDGSTTVTIPSQAEFIDAAIDISHILRTAKVEPPLRPKVIGSVVLAIYQGEISLNPKYSLQSINELVESVISQADDLYQDSKNKLIDALRLSGADFNRLSPFIGRIINILKRLNIRSVIHTDADFLGMFYEAFLRYGYDNKSLGIVFTPRHITRMCVDLVNVNVHDRVVDIACGTGGFLVSALDSMLRQAASAAAKKKVKSSIGGFDANPTVLALAALNMFFRGDGKSKIFNEDCFDENAFNRFRGKFTKAFLNPPFSQAEEPEKMFIDRSMESLEPNGILAVVVYAGVFADGEHKIWREQFLKKHKLLGVISLPEDLFYPTSAPTSIMIAEAHTPISDDDNVFLGRVWNDGYIKLKGRRIECEGNQILNIISQYHKFVRGEKITSEIVTTVKGKKLKDGKEWSPQEWLPQPSLNDNKINNIQDIAIMSIFQAISIIPDLSTVALSDFGEVWADLPELPLNKEMKVSDFFHIDNGKSYGEKHFPDGEIPYISSGDLNNSIIRLVDARQEEIFQDGGITLTAFGLANIQPWPFAARGNGGSSVRVLIPKYNMTVRELFWFAGQINLQRWRFFYARMAIKSRIARLKIKSPSERLKDSGESIYDRIVSFRKTFDKLSQLTHRCTKPSGQGAAAAFTL